MNASSRDLLNAAKRHAELADSAREAWGTDNERYRFHKGHADRQLSLALAAIDREQRSR